MDKYEYRLKTDHIRQVAARKEYQEAARLCDSIVWNKVKDVKMLLTVADIYTAVGRYQEAIDALIQAYEYAPIGRRIVYRLTELALMANNYEDAKEYFDEFCRIAPHDQGRYILLYKMACNQHASIDEKITILEAYKQQDFDERWAYELAMLYSRKGKTEKCVQLCDDIILWFGLGKYVEKALELKKKYAPLTEAQQAKVRELEAQKENEKYDQMKKNIGAIQGLPNTIGDMKVDSELDRVGKETAEDVRKMENMQTLQDSEAEKKSAPEMNVTDLDEKAFDEGGQTNTVLADDTRRKLSRMLSENAEESFRAPDETLVNVIGQTKEGLKTADSSAEKKDAGGTEKTPYTPDEETNVPATEDDAQVFEYDAEDLIGSAKGTFGRKEPKAGRQKADRSEGSEAKYDSRETAKAAAENEDEKVKEAEAKKEIVYGDGIEIEFEDGGDIEAEREAEKSEAKAEFGNSSEADRSGKAEAGKGFGKKAKFDESDGYDEAEEDAESGEADEAEEDADESDGYDEAEEDAESGEADEAEEDADESDGYDEAEEDAESGEADEAEEDADESDGYDEAEEDEESGEADEAEEEAEFEDADETDEYDESGNAGGTKRKSGEAEFKDADEAEEKTGFAGADRVKEKSDKAEFEETDEGSEYDESEEEIEAEEAEEEFEEEAEFEDADEGDEYDEAEEKIEVGNADRSKEKSDRAEFEDADEADGYDDAEEEIESGDADVAEESEEEAELEDADEADGYDEAEEKIESGDADEAEEESKEKAESEETDKPDRKKEWKKKAKSVKTAARETESKMQMTMLPKVNPANLSSVWHFTVAAAPGKDATDTALDYVDLLEEQSRHDLPEDTVKVTGVQLNGKDLMQSFDKLLGKIVIVLHASDMEQRIVDELCRVLDPNDLSLLVILTDTPANLTRMFTKYPKLAEIFTAEFMEVRQSASELMEYARDYADSQDAVLDQGAELYLMAVLENLADSEEKDKNGAVEAMIRGAIADTEKKTGGNLLRKLFTIRYDKEGRLILHEKNVKRASVKE